MTIEKDLKGSELTVTVTGRVDTATSPKLEAALEESLSDVSSLVFDFKKLEYISSAGLRVLLSAQKKLQAAGGRMVVKNLGETINEIFFITGFSEILTVE